MRRMGKTLWAKLPRLSRGWRIVRNLAAALAAALAVYALLGWPAMTRWGTFQRLAGSLLLAPSELVLQVDGGQTAYLIEGDGWAATGKVWPVLTLGRLFSGNDAMITQVVPMDGVVVLGLPYCDENGSLVAAVSGAPEEAVRGILELTIGDEVFSGTARREENGWLFFRLPPHEGENCAMTELWQQLDPWEGLEEYPYTLRLLDARGEAVQVVSSALPPAQNIWD